MERAAFVSDVLTQSVGMGVGSMNEFVTGMSAVAGIASPVGVGFDELGSTMAYLTSQNSAASEASTKLKAVITSL